VGTGFRKRSCASRMFRWKKQAVSSHLLPTYARVDLAFERGEGAWLITATGERYLDFTTGVAVNALGHAHPYMVKALTEQAQKVWHVSNLYRIPDGEKLADRLCAASFADTVFFQNSGAEALECAIKMARKYQSASGKPERFRIVTFEGAFHGRTLTTIAATGNKKYLDGFGPPVDGFDQVPFSALDAVKRAIGPATAAILIEPIQGEGGVRVVPHTFLHALRDLCDLHGLLLVFDEVQTGIGRTGDLFAYQHTGVTPDIMALAKALGGGFPIGACLLCYAVSRAVLLTLRHGGICWRGTHYPLAELAARALRLSGAELEQVVAAGLYKAFAERRELGENDLANAIQETVPLYETYEERVKELRDWARTRARPATLDARMVDLFAPSQRP